MLLRYLVFIIIGILAIVVVISNVNKSRFLEKESFFWVFAAIVLMTAPFSIKLINKISAMLNINYPPSLVFALMFVFVLFLIFRTSRYVHITNERTRDLVQINALQDHEFRILKAQYETISEKLNHTLPEKNNLN